MTDRQVTARGLQKVKDDIKIQQQHADALQAKMDGLVNMEAAVRFVNRKVRQSPLATKTTDVKYCKWMHTIFVDVAATYGVNSNTLKSKWGGFVQNNNTMPVVNTGGKPPALSQLEEGELKKWITQQSVANKSPSPDQVKEQARMIVKRRGGGRIDSQPFIASDKWLQNFMQRSKPDIGVDTATKMKETLVIVKARSIDVQRAALNPEQLTEFYVKYERQLEMMVVRAMTKKQTHIHILVTDEIGFPGYLDIAKGQEVVVALGQRSAAYTVIPTDRDHVTVIPVVLISMPIVVGADGKSGVVDFNTDHMTSQIIDSLYIFSGGAEVNTKTLMSQLDPRNSTNKSKEQLASGEAPSDNVGIGINQIIPTHLQVDADFNPFIAKTDSGYVNSTLMHEFVRDKIISKLRALNITAKHEVMLLWDQHASHFNKPLFDMLEEAKTFPFLLTPHASHLIQLQDQQPFALFKKLGRQYASEIQVRLRNMNRSLKIQDMPFVLYAALKQSHSQQQFAKALKQTGLLGNPDEVLVKKMNSEKAYAVLKEEYEEYEREMMAGGGNGENKENEEPKIVKKKKPVAPVAQLPTRAYSDASTKRSPKQDRTRASNPLTNKVVINPKPNLVTPNVHDSKVQALGQEYAFLSQLDPNVDARAKKMGDAARKRGIHSYDDAQRVLQARESNQAAKAANKVAFDAEKAAAKEKARENKLQAKQDKAQQEKQDKEQKKQDKLQEKQDKQQAAAQQKIDNDNEAENAMQLQQEQETKDAAIAIAEAAAAANNKQKKRKSPADATDQMEAKRSAPTPPAPPRKSTSGRAIIPSSRHGD